ncbi:hypothetical protein ACQPYK_17110 [Streptosporangium sp. CA-135522]|uniref:hypothetical protein n=1 Tax=Streptosporangium sp. CA-135522 TaxID=3240072 RepID=UPI003D90D841
MTEFGPEGQQLWKFVTDEFDLPEDKLTLLRRACHTADICSRLEAEIASGDVITLAGNGTAIVNRALTSHRQASETLSKLIKSLELPAPDEDS